ncbi:MAG: lipase family protein [Candidatus Caenarcaniphilales bacterium]|nr:lipase family protein [Candidatus Caenarcaniphilales bacterium]
MKRLPKLFDLDKAIELATLSNETYAQYKAWRNKESWSLPAEYELEIILDAVYENDNMPLGFICKKGSELYVVWRGTQDIEEWIEDAKYKQVPCSFIKDVDVELGFEQMYTTGDSKVASPQQKVLDYLATVNPSDYTNLWVTGHSLGAAIAVLNIADIASNTEHKSAILYSFAGPRVGDHNFASEYNSIVNHSYRVVNTHDEVPKLPPQDCPPILHTYHYEHVKHTVPITFGNFWNLAEDHSIQGYIKQLEAIKKETLVSA